MAFDGPRDLVKSTLTKEDFERVYALLDYPALGEGNDCGALCGSLCCQEYEPGVGMYLLPGEEVMFTGHEPWLRWSYKAAKHSGFPSTWKGLVAFVECSATCPREHRPIQCRTFPLMPYLDKKDNLSVRLDTLMGSLVCPLVRRAEEHPVSPEFARRVLLAWQILAADPTIRQDVEGQSRKLDQDQAAPWRRLLGLA